MTFIDKTFESSRIPPTVVEFVDNVSPLSVPSGPENPLEIWHLLTNFLVHREYLLPWSSYKAHPTAQSELGTLILIWGYAHHWDFFWPFLNICDHDRVTRLTLPRNRSSGPWFSFGVMSIIEISFVRSWISAIMTELQGSPHYLYHRTQKIH